MTLGFSGKTFYKERIRVLCVIAKKYSLVYENLWSSDGLNCDEDLI